MSIQSDAKQKNQLVYSFDQADSAVCTEPGPWGSSNDGYCAGLAIQWLRLRKTSQDYAQDALGNMIPDTHKSTRNQNVYDDSDYSTAFASSKLSIKGTVSNSGPPSASFIARSAGAHSSGWLISLRRSGGGHAVAVQYTRKTHDYRYFDANYGQFILNTKVEFTHWLRAFFADSGYGQRYLKETIMYRAF